ncbi:phosphoribosylglycinamide formyltransferase [Endomicrobiia bacterium]|nr:phosphoribosylglycinamide formyltransferase [Endomicrobiia bacterium]
MNSISVNILVLVSGGGTNLQALIDAEKAGRFSGGTSGLSGKIVAVVSDRAGVYALERAKLAGIPAFVEALEKTLTKPERRRDLSDRILKICQEQDIGLIIYAGFLSILTGELIEAYAGKMINIHPSLLPKFGGQGMYGERVHQAVLASGEKESGCTVHIVDAGTDTGPILIQRTVPVLAGDTADTLAERIHREEHIAIVDAAIMMVTNILTGGKS